MTPRVGLAVVFAALGEAEQAAVDRAWTEAVQNAVHWQPTFIQYGIQPLQAKPKEVDILVYLGESSRFDLVAGELTRDVPVVLVKSTVEELMEPLPGSARRYRMSTGVDGIASALAKVAPQAHSVEWTALPWPGELRSHLHIDEAEQRYVNKSLDAFRKTVEQRGLAWLKALPGNGQPFSVFLTMHDPTAAILAEAALDLWPQSTVLTADGMVSTETPSRKPWPNRLIRTRHWSPQEDTQSNQSYKDALKGAPLPDMDSPGMTFGTLVFLDQAFRQGVTPDRLDEAGIQPGPLGPMRFMPSGRADPERLIIFRGQERSVLKIEA